MSLPEGNDHHIIWGIAMIIDGNPNWMSLEGDILWMEEILHQLVDGQNPIVIPRNLQCFIVPNSYPAWCRISSIHSIMTSTSTSIKPLPSLVMTNIANWKDPPCYSWENPRHFDWAIFNSFLYVYQRVWLDGFCSLFTHINQVLTTISHHYNHYYNHYLVGKTNINHYFQ